MNISERVRALRKALGLTQETMGARVGMSRVEINHIENGRRSIVHRDVFKRFAAGVGVPDAILDAYLAGNLALDVIADMAKRKPDGEAA
jgi:transcriptional regulator with XRE-family HTH domain